MSKHEKFMKIAIEEAKKGRVTSSPNPPVGAIIVKDNKIIAKGFTQPFGKDHAEVNAIKNATESTKDADIYVTLEPCNHYGKTPPCTKAILEAGIKRVFIGIEDPNPKVSGSGIKFLQENKRYVRKGIREEEVKTQLEYFLTYITKKRPFFILKSAVTLDGRIATEQNNPKWITSEESRKYVHKLRYDVDAILTGVGTVVSDNPLLNVRLENATHQPARIILDSSLRTPIESNIIRTADKQQTIIYHHSDSISRINEFKHHNVILKKVKRIQKGLDIDEIIIDLHSRGFTSVLIESGTKITSMFLRRRLIDKLYYFIGPKFLGGKKYVTEDIGINKMTDAFNVNIKKVELIDQDIMIIGYPQK